jgi:hypothetical protein
MDPYTTNCPYDGNALTVEINADGRVLLVCRTCRGAWEPHGCFVGNESREITQSAT